VRPDNGREATTTETARENWFSSYAVQLTPLICLYVY